MKFEEPIVEVQKFDVVDILTNSADDTEAQETTISRKSTEEIPIIMEGECVGDMRDNLNFDNCFG